MKSSFILSVIVISMNMVGCATSIPDWYAATELPEYPQDSYICAAGIGNDYDEALINAQASIAAQIQVSLKSSIVNSVKEITGDGISEFSEITEKNTHSYVEEQLRAVEVVRKADNEGKYYIYAALNKRSLVATLRAEMDLLISQINEFINLAHSSIRNGHIITAMENYLAARQVLIEYASKNALYLAFADERHTDSQRLLSINRLETEIRESLDGIRLEVVSGNDQSVTPGVELPLPIIFIASYKNSDNSNMISLQRFPFIVTNVTSGNKRQVSTDVNGKAAVHFIADGGLGRHQLICKPHIKHLPEYFRSQLIKVVANAYYNISPIEGLAFSVEVYSNAGVRQPDVEKSIIQTIANNGYTVSNDAPLLLLGKLKDPDIREIKQLSGPLFIATTELIIELIAAQTKDVLGSTFIKGKGTGTNSEIAIDNAMRNIKLENESFGKILQQEALKAVKMNDVDD